jgi:hypothetical protein
MFGSQWFAAPSVASYEIGNSCLFNSGDSAYMTRTPSASNRKTFTISVWFKLANIGAANCVMFGATTNTTGSGTYAVLRVPEAINNRLEFWDYTNGTFNYLFVANAWLRDPAAWYHALAVLDTTQSTEADRAALYLNGEEVDYVAGGSEYPTQDYEGQFNSNIAHEIGSAGAGLDQFWDGYMADVCFIDGTAYTPSDFGETNDEGIWVPKNVGGLTFGTNGFLMKFGTNSALGDDTSGNTNDYTTSGLTTADQMEDTPTNNQITFNELNNQQSGGTLTEGDTVYSGPGTRTMVSLTSNIPSTGKWAVAFSTNDVSTNNGWNFGFTKSNNSNFGDAAGSNEDVGASDGINMNPSSSVLYLWNYISGSGIEPGQAITTSDEFWLAVDMATGKCFLGIYDASATAMVWIAADAGLDGNPATGANPSVTISDMIGSTEYTFAVGAKAPDLTLMKSADISGTIPTGYTYFENISDFPAPAITDPSAHFQTELYTGNGTAIGSGGKAVTFSGNSDMDPDLVWIKNRDATDSNAVYDSVRGTTKQLETDSYPAETTESEGLTTFGSDGFTVGSLDQVNTNTEDFVSWNWKEGATPGFDILTYAGNGSNRTISHSLGAVPKMIILKSYDNVYSWTVYHEAMGNTKIMKLDEAEATTTNSGFWQDTTPTSSVFSVGTHGNVNNSSSNYITYLWAEIDSFSKFGSYTGNGNADGPFAYCGFKPNWVMIKNTEAATAWAIWDIARDKYNPAEKYLLPNSNAAEATAGGLDIDILSNGFKMRNTDSGIGTDGEEYIFAAFAENPFGGDGVAPATAR